ncbi:MAG: CHAT domain-containing protein [Candidatus Rhabdochlamydia sp.]
MGISIKALSSTGLIKTPLSSSHTSNHKIRLYSFPDQTLATIIKIQTTLHKEHARGKVYEGNIYNLNEDVLIKPYLLKEGPHFKLISKEDVIQLQQNSPHFSSLKQDPIQGEEHHVNPQIIPETVYANHEIVSYDLHNTEDAVDQHYQEVRYHENCLKIAQENHHIKEQARAYGNLGNAYSDLGDYHQSIEVYQRCLTIAIELKNNALEGMVYGNLGLVYHTLGDYTQAIKYYNEDLRIAKQLESMEGEAIAYGNLGNAYDALKNYFEALNCHNNVLKIAINTQNSALAEVAYTNLGNAYHALGKHDLALECQENGLMVAQERGNHEGIGRIACNLGKVYQTLKKYEKALKLHLQELTIHQALHDRPGEGRAYGNLGEVYLALGEYTQAEECFRKGAQIVTSFQQNAKEIQWKLGLFEEWLFSYMGLEKSLLLQEKTAEALEIADQRRARVLSSLISQKLGRKAHQAPSLAPLSTEEMQQLAKKLHTTFIVYSPGSICENEQSLRAWVVSSQEKLSQLVYLPITDNALLEPNHIFKKFPYQAEMKCPKRGEKRPSQLFQEKLTYWYDVFITPLEKYLPNPGSSETITIIPDTFLAHLPFGAFYNTKQEQYFIEGHPISIAPSIQVISLLDQFPKLFSPQALLIGNPTTLQEQDNQLGYAESEVRDTLAPLLQTPPENILTQKNATIENVFKYAPLSRYIHIACHGLAEQKPPGDPHSVFEGFFKLAPDVTHPVGQLHAKEINTLAIKADLVFMSACHLGRGNLQKEGSIGPIWSFLGAGALSTIASYWPLPEGDMTVKMVETFYKHYLGIETPKLNKARALQQAVLREWKSEKDEEGETW